ncbi:MAG: bifunctional (p)ppGpp synthetase/guanosine-3',5'-bis(diphosphate) 3'-pyrophosphohydrolase [Clostridia bacterium]|nr:bifunctional (p)ppGpp synthetase/guanosine-3',5'-bis(diphosphate) 3'-pyrophosphohydrolase [Clostridia bacterium]
MEQQLNENEKLFGELIDVLNEQGMKFEPILMKNIFDYTSKIYKDSKRYKGESTLSHSVHVAIIVAKLKIGIEPVYAAILHEVPKFEDYSYKDVEIKFGKEIATLVKDASKLYLLNYDGQADVEADKLRKMFMAIAKDIRVVILKLADRLYNMRNIYEEDEEYQRLKATETMNVYAPIAHRLGMSEVKSELEDISFNILNPEEFEKVRNSVELGKEERKEYINYRIEQIKSLLEKENIKATIYGRPKYYYSIYKKTKKNNCRVEDLFDLYAVRVIVDSVKDCYSVLGIIHQNFKPMPGRFKDYIAVPKTNMYQSLHTTLFGEDKAPFEVQIRTWDMHNIAEYGVAAHFLYKEGSTQMTDSDEMLNWIRKTLEFEQEMGEVSYSDIKVELFGDEVFVFTPKGEIKSLPKGATPIDYAYNIHQHIGEMMVGAKINGKMVPITTKLKNTDVVEIITSKTSSGPKADWLKHVKTNSAKNKIVSFLKKQSKEINIEKGIELLDKEIAKTGITKDELLSEKYIKPMIENSRYKNVEEFYENIGFGVLTPKKALNKILDEYKKINKVEEPEKIEKFAVINADKSNYEGVVVEGIDNCLVKFAKCCNPIPGDDIIGYITYGKGVSVHRIDCPNISSLELTHKSINVSWKKKDNISYGTKIIVIANDRNNLSVDILKMLQDTKVKITGFTAKATKERECIIDITLEVASVEELQRTIKNIKKIDSVYEVKRAK